MANSWTNQQGSLILYDGSATPNTLTIGFIDSAGSFPSDFSRTKYRWVQNQGINSHIVRDDDDTSIPENDVTLILSDALMKGTPKQSEIIKWINDHQYYDTTNSTWADLTTTNDGSGILASGVFTLGVKIKWDNGIVIGYDYKICEVKNAELMWDKDLKLKFKIIFGIAPTLLTA